MNMNKAFLKISTSVLALASVSSLGASLAWGQVKDTVNDQQIEEVVVTGSSIKGAAPVGSNLVTVGAADIENVGAESISQVLTTIPTLSANNTVARGGTNGGAGASVYVHGLGNTEKNSTLVLLDGNRLPNSGLWIVDPNDFPKNMIERVDVLAEGASSVYGSDAVAGVVNFVTRKKYDGLQVAVQGELVSGASVGKTIEILTGKSWDGGNVIASFDYSFDGRIKNTARWRTDPLVQTQAALAHGFSATEVAAAKTNFGNFSCNPATIQLNGAGNEYLNAQGTTNFSTAAANAPCSQWASGDYVPTDIREHGMIKFSQVLFPNVTLTGMMSVSNRYSTSLASRGILTGVTAFGPTYNGGNPTTVAVTQNGTATTTSIKQQNPFYTNPPGTTSTTQKINYDFNQLYGPGAYTATADYVQLAYADVNWDINDHWSVDIHAAANRDEANQGASYGVVNQSLALLALNGTAIAGGTAATTPIANTNTILTQSLTTTNALDVWNPAATNRTSPAVLANLVATQNVAQAVTYHNSLEQIRAVANGDLGDLLGAGPVKIAVGAEYLPTSMTYLSAVPGNAGGDNVSTALNTYDFYRNVKTAFVELDVPVVSVAMNIPYVQKLEFDISGRYDDYSDVGETKNPKIAFNWDVAWGLRLRGNWSTSFVAPPLATVGDPTQFGNTTYSNVKNAGSVNLPVAVYPKVTQLGIAGCTVASTSCTTPSSVQGLSLTSNAPNNQPQKGHGWVVGFDLTPDVLPGFNVNASWWHVTYLGGLTAGSATIAAQNPTLNSRITVYPGCATAAQIADQIGHLPIQVAIPACVSYIYQNANANILNEWVSGIDGGLNYRFDTGYGMVTVGSSFAIVLTQQQGYANVAIGPIPASQFRYEGVGTTGIGQDSGIPLTARPHIGWSNMGWQADIFVNYQSHYRFFSSPIRPEGLNALGIFDRTGGDPVPSHETVDLHFGYSFDDGMFGNETLSLSIRNAMNTSAPFANSSTGIGDFNDIGRMIDLGFTVRL